MLLSLLLNTLLLGILLYGCKLLFAKKPELISPANKLYKYQDVLVILAISLAFVSVKYMFDSLGKKRLFSTSGYSYLDANQQFKIGKAFYLGENLPKDNMQALNWLLLAAEQGHKEAQELIHLFGYNQGNVAGVENEATAQIPFPINIIPADKIKIKLKDIVGMEQATQDMAEFLEFVKNPEKFKKLGARIPKGIIMYGPPGTGKTLLAKAFAGDAGVNFIAISGSAFEETYVGMGAARIRELFNVARKNKPVIIFIDEIDALAPSRQNDEASLSHIQTVNQLLSEMTTIDEEKNSGILVLAATNRLEAIDPALLRPGRFDWQIPIRLPTDTDRKAILEKFLADVVTAKDIDITQLVEETAGYSGADLDNLVNEAAIFAATNNKSAVDQASFDAAFKKIATYEKALSPTLTVKILASSEVKTQFSDIAGMSLAKQEVSEVVDFLKDPQAFTRLGAKPPGGILIYGPPGTGKTLMARAIAGEAKVTFISVAGSAFDEQWIGVGAARVRELFTIARKYKPCVVFIDEIDALVPKRSGQDMTGQDQTINQFLNEMDNVQSTLNDGIVFIGATNRLDILDPAALRPGRFDRKVYFRLPSLQEREQILALHIKSIKAAKNINIKTLAQITSGYSGADLANLVNEAAIEATRKNKSEVDMASFEEANDKIALGVSQDGVFTDEHERKVTAYHEAGHAIVGLLHPDHPRTLHKMTIGLRDESLGVTHFRFDSDKHSFTKKEFESLISTALGGYIAEELIYGKDNVTSGASADLLYANEIAKDMVTKYGMADDQSLILSEVFNNDRNVIDSAEQILKRDYAVAKEILEKNISRLHLLADALLEQETLNYQQIVSLLKLPAESTPPN